MYRSSADHSLTGELAALVEIPVVASGDICTNERALELISNGAAAVMVGRAAQGNPWLLGEILSGEPADPSKAQIVAELVHFMREIRRELGERRAEGFLKKFYGWYLRRGRLPRQLRRELVEAESLSAAERLLLSASPGAEALVAELESEIADLSETTLELPIGQFGGG
jgi:tRNA-dihydrouridine synthase B